MTMPSGLSIPTSDCGEQMTVGRILVLLVTGLTIAACSIGASVVKRDRFDYNTAIAQSWKDQMLLNVVKLRYADTPVFLDVTSVISQYELQRGLSASALFSSGPDLVALGGDARYIERPTITFTPPVGRKVYQATCGAHSAQRRADAAAIGLACGLAFAPYRAVDQWPAERVERDAEACRRP